MYLTAHRVRSPTTQREAVNAFVHVHGPFYWPGSPPFTPEQNPGTLLDSIVDPGVRPPGNLVRSYLDILTPDSTPAPEIRRAFRHLIVDPPPTQLPATVLVRPCWFRYGMQQSLGVKWRNELVSLFDRLDQLLGRLNQVC